MRRPPPWGKRCFGECNQRPLARPWRWCQTGRMNAREDGRGEKITMNFEIIESEGKPIKSWTRGVQVEDAAKQQLRNLAGLPFVFKHIAAMPDVHWGMGATVGSVIATKGAII